MEEPSPRDANQRSVRRPKSGGMGRPDERETLSQCAPIAEHDMAYAKLNPMYEFVKGAATKPKKIDGHNHGTYQILQHREAATTNPNCQRVYIKPADAYKRSTPLTEDDVRVRTRFTNVSRLVAVRKKDPSKMATDQAAFLAQKDSAGGKKTIVSYLWMVCGDAYDQEHPNG